MALKEQIFLQPGTYRLNNGSMREITARDIREYINGTLLVLEKGGQVPVLSEHADPGADDGAPQFSQFSDALRTVGWMQDLKQNPDGSASVILDITNPKYAAAIDNGSIRFSSPELRESYTNGLGQNFGRVFSHFALTPKPRNPKQTSLKGVAQFSLENLQMAKKELDINIDADSDPGEEAGNPEPPQPEPAAPPMTDPAPIPQPKIETKPENPDIPNSNTGMEEQQKTEAIVAILEQIGVSLPSDYSFDSEGALDILLASLKTHVNMKAEAESKVAEQQETEQAPIVEEQPVSGTQFSDAQKARLAKADDALREHTTANLQSRRLPPGLIEALTREENIQFSDDGQLVKSFTPSQVADLLERFIPENFQFSEPNEIEHPDGDGFFAEDDSEQPTGEKAEGVADDFVDFVGMRAPEPTGWTNDDAGTGGSTTTTKRGRGRPKKS